jgi:hypothetical protein
VLDILDLHRKIQKNQPTRSRALFSTIDRRIYGWIVGERMDPPSDEFKRKTIQEYGKEFGPHIFIETGTLFGDTVEAVIHQFKKIISIELDRKLYEKAAERFKRHAHVSILQGDSGVVLESVMEMIDEPVLFWLDGHYSGGITAQGELDTPIIQELETVLTHKIKNHCILIDDARCFIGENGYPIIKDIQSLVSKHNKDMYLRVENDIIRILPIPEEDQLGLDSYRESRRSRAGRFYRSLKKAVKKLIGYRPASGS